MKDYKRLTDRVIAEMLRNTEGESWDSDNIEAQCYIRLAELENKIESGEFIPAAEYESAKHRAEVAERALLTACVNLIKDEEDNVNMELLARVVYTKFLRKAEKELAEVEE